MKAMMVLIFLCLLSVNVSYAEAPALKLEQRVIDLERKVDELEFKIKMMASINKTKEDGLAIKEKYERERDKTIQYLLESNISNVVRIKNLEIDVKK